LRDNNKESFPAFRVEISKAQSSQKTDPTVWESVEKQNKAGLLGSEHNESNSGGRWAVWWSGRRGAGVVGGVYWSQCTQLSAHVKKRVGERKIGRELSKCACDFLCALYFNIYKAGAHLTL